MTCKFDSDCRVVNLDEIASGELTSQLVEERGILYRSAYVEIFFRPCQRHVERTAFFLVVAFLGAAPDEKLFVSFGRIFRTGQAL